MAIKNGGPNLNRQTLDIGASGNPTTILATGPTRGWVITENVLTHAGAANTRQGFVTFIPNDVSANGFTTPFGRPAPSASDPSPSFDNWNKVSEYGPYGEVFAGAGGASGGGMGTTTATVLAKVQSLTATPTTIEIVEYF